MSNSVRLPFYSVNFQATSDELSQTLPYNIVNYSIDKLWDRVDRGAGIRVGVCDTGISSYHESRGDLQGAVVAKRDFTRSRTGTECVVGHGTHVASTIGARDNDKGIAGVIPECELVVAKVLGDNGMGDNQWVSEGIRYCVDQGCDFINLSLGSPSGSSTLEKAIQYARDNQVLLVCAAGNDGANSRVGYPGRYRDTVAVGAIDLNLNLAEFSSRGPEVDVVGPGVQILGCYKGDTYASISGTSMATPWLTGSLGLLKKATQVFGVEADFSDPVYVHNLLKTFCLDLGAAGRDHLFGFGVLNVNQAFLGFERLQQAPPKDKPQPKDPDKIVDAEADCLTLISRLIQVLAS